MVLLPDHLHFLMALPSGDVDYSTRIGQIKRTFTAGWLAAGLEEGESCGGRMRQRYRGVWQKRFWEHTIRDARDFAMHLDYIHVNPVKHRLVEWPRDWEWSSFHRYMKAGWYDRDWCGHIEIKGMHYTEP
jgi:putative transposase